MPPPNLFYIEAVNYYLWVLVLEREDAFVNEYSSSYGFTPKGSKEEDKVVLSGTWTWGELDSFVIGATGSSVKGAILKSQQWVSLRTNFHLLVIVINRNLRIFYKTVNFNFWLRLSVFYIYEIGEIGIRIPLIFRLFSWSSLTLAYFL